MFSLFYKASVPTLLHFFVLVVLFVKTQAKPHTKTNPAGRLNGLKWAGFCAVLKLDAGRYIPGVPNTFWQRAVTLIAGLVRGPHLSKPK
jgi:hypothetical protein